MSESRPVETPTWRFYAPFLLGDVILLGASGVIFAQAQRPMNAIEVACFTVCVALGAGLGTLPFLLRHRQEARLLETLAGTERVVAAVERLREVEQVADRIANATGLWQMVQDTSAQTVASAKDIAERMAAETKDFTNFMQRANDGQRQTLQLEIEKLRRAEGDWIQVSVRILDHVYALYRAALRSEQRGLMEQIGNFQNACRDVARRVGLVAYIAENGLAFDPQLHQLPDPNAPAPEGAIVVDTLGTGFSFQGQVLRLPVVIVDTRRPAPPATTTSITVAPPLPAPSAPPEPSSAALPESSEAPEVPDQMEEPQAAVAEAPTPPADSRPEPHPAPGAASVESIPKSEPELRTEPEPTPAASTEPAAEMPPRPVAEVAQAAEPEVRAEAAEPPTSNSERSEPSGPRQAMFLL